MRGFSWYHEWGDVHGGEMLTVAHVGEATAMERRCSRCP